MLTRRQILQAGPAGAAAFSAPLMGGALMPSPARAAVIDKPAKLLLGFPPGGSTDVVARLLLNHIKEYAPGIIVDNRAGAGGRIAMQALKTAAPDGATLGLSPASMLVIYPHVYSNLAYDPVKDFEPVCTACNISFGLTAGPMVPDSVMTFQQFVDWCRANPDKASYGTSGAGSALHFAGEMIAKGANFPFVHVAYRGAAPAIQDLVAGQIASCLAVLTNVLPHLGSGKVRVLVTTGEKRSPFLPNVPSLSEIGLKDQVAEEWFGIYMPAGTPRDYAAKFAAMVRQALAQPDVIDNFRKLAVEPGTHQLDEFRALIASDLAKWGEVVRATGFKME